MVVCPGGERGLISIWAWLSVENWLNLMLNCYLQRDEKCAGQEVVFIYKEILLQIKHFAIHSIVMILFFRCYTWHVRFIALYIGLKIVDFY
jgi:hypothetical protein